MRHPQEGCETTLLGFLALKTKDGKTLMLLAGWNLRAKHGNKQKSNGTSSLTVLSFHGLPLEHGLPG